MRQVLLPKFKNINTTYNKDIFHEYVYRGDTRNPYQIMSEAYVNLKDNSEMRLTKGERIDNASIGSIISNLFSNLFNDSDELSECVGKISF